MNTLAMNTLNYSGLRSRLCGLWLPLITPFRDGGIDEISLRRLLRHYCALPIDGLILAATSGEGLTLETSELDRLVALARDELDRTENLMPIVLGLSGSGTTMMCDMLDETAAWPIDGYLIASPYYSRPSQRGLMLYNIPYRTSVNLDNEMLLELARHPNIVGLKDCGADRARTIDLLRRRPSGFRILTGEDAHYFEALCDGADGAILLSAHVETAAFAAIRSLVLQGDAEAARERWEGVALLSELLFAEPSPAPAKYWLSRTGLIDSADVRLPMVEIGAELATRLDAEIDRRRSLTALTL
jgi:4-hydroxy-tetrahydrodipicolinate synthase